MRNFQGFVFIWIKTYVEIFKSAFVYLSYSTWSAVKAQKQPPKVFVKKDVLKTFANLTRKQLFSLNTQVSSCGICKSFKNNYFEKNLRTTASESRDLFRTLSKIFDGAFLRKHLYSTKNEVFSLRISSVNVSSVKVSCRFDHIYWRNP